ncbi:MAG: caspase family protein [Cyclobacteriaceae bacterium]
MRFSFTIVAFFIQLNALAQSIETVIQRGHELAVITICASPDSNYVVTGSRDKSAKLWELSTGREVRSFLGHDFSVTSVDVSRDGKFLLTGSNDETVKLWEIETGKEIFSINPVHEQIRHVAISPDMKFFVATALRYNAQIFDFSSRKKIKEIEVNPESNRNGVDIAISPDSKWIAFGEDNRIVNVYRTSDWQKVYTFEYGAGWCGGCSTFCNFSPDSKNLIMVSHNGSAKKYDLSSGQLVKQYADELHDPSSISFSPDNKKIVLALKKEIVVWENETGKEIRFNPGVEQEINKTIFTNDGKKLLITCDNNTTMVWDLQKQKVVQSLTGFLNLRDKGGITYDPNFIWDMQIAKYVRFKNNLLISNDGKTLIKGKFGSKVKQWDIATGKSAMEFVGHSKAVLCYDLSTDGKRLVTGGGEGKIILWNALTGDTIKTIKAHREPILDIHFNSDETKVVSSSWDGRMIAWDINNGKSVNYFDFENNSALNILWGQSDLYLFAGLGKDLKMYELDTRTAVRDFVGHSDVISSLRLSNDKQQLLSASWDGSVRLWNVGTGLMEKKFVGHRGAAHIAIFSPDGKNIFSAGADRQIRVWDLVTSKVVRTFDGHKAEVTSLLFSPDNKMLISHSVDGATKFWDLNSGKEFFEHIHFGEKEWMVKNPEGYFNGTQDARQFIHFVNGMKTYGADQFFDEFYRPDLLPKIFQNRGGDGSQGINQKIKGSPPPTLRIAVLPTNDPTKAEIFLKLTDNGAGIEGLKLFHNGKRITLKENKFTQGKDQSTAVREVVNLVGGTNTFTVSALNKDKVESDPVSAEIFSESSNQNSVCHILAVGINQYKNPKMVLNYAKPDAESFGKAVDSKGLFKNIALHTLYDIDASKENILKKLDELSTQIHQEDVFIFYYAGHGSMVEGQFFFIPSESARLYDLSSLKKEAIDASMLQEKFKNIKALKQLIIMDACQSGGSVELLANRGAAEEKAIAQLSRSAGIHVMASAGSEQFAAEFAELGHGIFTYLLIKGLQGEADGSPKDGKVTIYELKSFLDDQVPELTRKLKGKPQYPYTFSRGQDFPVVIDQH